MYQLPALTKKVLGYVCQATANERSLRGIDIVLHADRDLPGIALDAVHKAIDQLVFLGMVGKKYVEQWQCDTYFATELGFSYNRGSVMDREV